MNAPAPRLELRVFGHGLVLVEARLRRLAPCEAIDESREVYLVDGDRVEHNVKIRGGHLELKTLVERDGDLERWRPAGRWTLPLPRSELVEHVFPGLGESAEAGLPATVSKEALLSWAARGDVPLARANVFKRRFRFHVGGCAAERDELTINGAAIESVAVESEEAAAVRAVRRELGLETLENCAYPRALARILGLLPLPEERDYE